MRKILALLLLLPSAVLAQTAPPANVQMENGTSRAVTPAATYCNAGAGWVPCSGAAGGGGGGSTPTGTAGSPNANVVSVQGVSGGTAQNIAAASLPLPTGAATAANQTTMTTALGTIVQRTDLTSGTQISKAYGVTAGGVQKQLLTDANGNLVAAGKQESFQLVAGNTPSTAAVAFGGDYILSQTCTTYGTLNLQVLGPDGSTYQTVLTKTASDTTGGTGLALGSFATVKIMLTGTAGCSALLARVPA